MNNQKIIRLGFFRGSTSSKSIGVTDWRIGLYLPDFGIKTFIFGQGETDQGTPKNVELISYQGISIPILRTLFLSIFFAKKAKELDLDVVVCNPGMALAGILYRLTVLKKPIILDVRSTPVETSSFIGVIQKIYFQAILNVQFFNAISTISTGMLAELHQKYNVPMATPSVVWSSGFDHRIFSPRDKTDKNMHTGLRDKFIVMFHGSLSPSRGLQQAVISIRLLLDLGMRDIALVFIGAGSAKSELSSLVKNLGLEERVFFLPPVSHEQIPDLIARADLGIDPLPNHPWWVHQSALKVVEYLAMGKPVLATDIPCHRGISSAVLLVPDHSPQAIASAIVGYRDLSDSARTEIKKTAVRDAQKHTWRERARILANFIRQQVLTSDYIS